MKLLVTGSSGQVGRELIRRAADRNDLELIATDRRQLDLGRRDDIDRVIERHKPNFVINAAAYTAVDRAEDERELATRINGEAPGWLGAACAQSGIPLIHFSTDYVFDGAKSAAYVEGDVTGPLGAYGAGKLAGELALQASGANSLILRVSWVFAGHGGNFVRTMLRLGAEREELRIVADQRGGPTYAGHIAEAALALAERYQLQRTLPWGVYHFAGGPTVSWQEFAIAILQSAVEKRLITRMPKVHAIATSDYPTRAPRPANSEMDCSKAQALLGLSRPDWRAGLEKTLDELLA